MQVDPNREPRRTANEIKSDINAGFALVASIFIRSAFVVVAGYLVTRTNQTGWNIKEGAPHHLDSYQAAYDLSVKPIVMTPNGTLAENSGYGMNATLDPDAPINYGNEQAFFDLMDSAAKTPVDDFVWMVDTTFWLGVAIAAWYSIEKLVSWSRSYYDLGDYRSSNNVLSLIKADVQDHAAALDWARTVRNDGKTVPDPIMPERKILASLPMMGGGYIQNSNVDENELLYKIFHTQLFLNILFKSLGYSPDQVKKHTDTVVGYVTQLMYVIFFTALMTVGNSILLERNLAKMGQDAVLDLVQGYLDVLVQGGNCNGPDLFADCTKTADQQAFLKGTHDQQTELATDDVKSEYYSCLAIPVATLIAVWVGALILQCCKSPAVVVNNVDHDFAPIAGDAIEEDDVANDEPVAPTQTSYFSCAWLTERLWGREERTGSNEPLIAPGLTSNNDNFA